MGLTTGGVSAQLRWEKSVQEFRPTVSETNVVARYAFVNEGKETVKILAVETSCDCTRADHRKDAYAAGEKGEIVVNFNFGTRVGLQEKMITVKTDAPQGAMSVLRLKVDIPQLLKVTPGFLLWKKGEAAEAKVVRIQAQKQAPVKIRGVRSTPDEVEVQIRVLEEGREYELVIKPKSTGENLTAMVRLETDVTPSATGIPSIHVLVR